MTPTPTKEPVAAPRRRWKLGLILIGLVLLPVAGFALYAFTALHWSYSDGERAGILQKFSRKGWLCKTYEGELAMSIVPGITPTIWEFSVRDAAVVEALQGALGKRVALHYTEHRGVPTTCFAETSYFVDGLHSIR